MNLRGSSGYCIDDKGMYEQLEKRRVLGNAFSHLRVLSRNCTTAQPRGVDIRACKMDRLNFDRVWAQWDMRQGDNIKHVLVLVLLH